MNEFLTRAVGPASMAVLLGSSVGVTALVPAQVQAALPDDAAVAAVAEGASTQVVSVPDVKGTFTFSQQVVTPTAQIARALGGVDKVLCGAAGGVVHSSEEVVADALDWTIRVGGDGVRTELCATLGELAESGTQHTVMGCTCLGNPADGLATVNAGCTGITLASVFDLAGLAEGANTVTFVGADGYRVSLPLDYVRQRTSMIVYQVNGEPLDQSVGGVNQLWLGATAARYFASDVVEILVTCEEQPPAAPGTPEAGDVYANRPNVGIVAGTSA